MITSHFELQYPIPIAHILQQVEESGTVQRLVAAQEHWEIDVVFPDYQAASELFGSFYEEHADFNIVWMVKDQTPFKEHDWFPQSSADRSDVLKQGEPTS